MGRGDLISLRRLLNEHQSSGIGLHEQVNLMYIVVHIITYVLSKIQEAYQCYESHANNKFYIGEENGDHYL